MSACRYSAPSRAVGTGVFARAPTGGRCGDPEQPISGTAWRSWRPGQRRTPTPGGGARGSEGISTVADRGWVSFTIVAWLPHFWERQGATSATRCHRSRPDASELHRAVSSPVPVGRCTPSGVLRDHAYLLDSSERSSPELRAGLPGANPRGRSTRSRRSAAHCAANAEPGSATPSLNADDGPRAAMIPDRGERLQKAAGHLRRPLSRVDEAAGAAWTVGRSEVDRTTVSDYATSQTNHSVGGCGCVQAVDNLRPKPEPGRRHVRVAGRTEVLVPAGRSR